MTRIAALVVGCAAGFRAAVGASGGERRVPPSEYRLDTAFGWPGLGGGRCNINGASTLRQCRRVDARVELRTVHDMLAAMFAERARESSSWDTRTGINPGNKLSPTEPNSEQLKRL